MADFNIFQILSKDDKELVHSSFLKYLVEHSNVFSQNLLGIDNGNIKTVDVEYVKKKCRFDILVTQKDSESFHFIENKFKCFPNKQQLDNYDDVIRKNYSGKNIFKILICFDEITVRRLQHNWRVVTYKDILTWISLALNTEKFQQDHLLFITHYYNFLNEYHEKYIHFSADASEILKNSDAKENKFWLNLLYSDVENILTEDISDLYFKTSATKVPLINIHKESWIVNGVEHVMQFQGRHLKFYIHSNDHTLINKLLNSSLMHWNNPTGKFKKLTKGRHKTNYIYQEDILSSNKLSQFNAFEIKCYLVEFINSIDNIMNIVYQGHSNDVKN